MLNRLAGLLAKYPIKSMLFTLLAILILAGGVRNIEMNTGNDTLVSRDSKVYKNNQQLEEEFGGESIVVLYEATGPGNILATDRLKHMKNLEEKLNVNQDIYSIISPISVIEQMSAKQGEKYHEGINEIADSLEKMGNSLIDIGNQVNDSTSGGADQLSLDRQMQELNQEMTRMMEGQEKLKGDKDELVNGYVQFGSQTKEAGIKPGELASMMEPANPQQKEKEVQLKKMSMQLFQLSEKMIQVSEKSASLPQASSQTINDLKVESGLARQQDQFGKMQEEQAKQKKELSQMGTGLGEMGNKLGAISDHLETMNQYADTMHPALPDQQETLDHLVYDEDGKLKEIFEEVVMDDQTMAMIIKFEGNASDASKGEITALIKNYLADEKLASTKMMVSGKPVLDDAIRSSMKESMQKMMILSLMFMVVVLLFTMKVSWRLLSLSAILVAVMGTVGLMGWVQIPITMVSMAVFPILIGLGIDYAIQFQSRYSEEMEVEADPNEYE